MKFLHAALGGGNLFCPPLANLTLGPWLPLLKPGISPWVVCGPSVRSGWTCSISYPAPARSFQTDLSPRNRVMWIRIRIILASRNRFNDARIQVTKNLPKSWETGIKIDKNHQNISFLAIENTLLYTTHIKSFYGALCQPHCQVHLSKYSFFPQHQLYEIGLFPLLSCQFPFILIFPFKLFYPESWIIKKNIWECQR